jgi:hypothetical protein
LGSNLPAKNVEDQRRTYSDLLRFLKDNNSFVAMTEERRRKSLEQAEKMIRSLGERYRKDPLALLSAALDGVSSAPSIDRLPFHELEKALNDKEKSAVTPGPGWVKTSLGRFTSESEASKTYEGLFWWEGLSLSRKRKVDEDIVIADGSHVIQSRDISYPATFGSGGRSSGGYTPHVINYVGETRPLKRLRTTNTPHAQPLIDNVFEAYLESCKKVEKFVSFSRDDEFVLKIKETDQADREILINCLSLLEPTSPEFDTYEFTRFSPDTEIEGTTPPSDAENRKRRIRPLPLIELKHSRLSGQFKETLKRLQRTLSVSDPLSSIADKVVHAAISFLANHPEPSEETMLFS